MSSLNSFQSRSDLVVGDETFEIFRVDAVKVTKHSRFSLKVFAGEPSAHRRWGKYYP